MRPWAPDIDAQSLLTYFVVLIEDKVIQKRPKIVQLCAGILYLVLYNLHIFASDQLKDEGEKKGFFLIF